MRVIVTGSPTWPHPQIVRAALSECLRACEHRGEWLTVVHSFRHGPEREANEWAWAMHKARRPVRRPEAHPIHRKAPCRHTCPRGHRDNGTCPRAGYYVNAEIVAAGADLILAFLHNGHRESEDCLRRARLAGIPDQEFTP